MTFRFSFDYSSFDCSSFDCSSFVIRLFVNRHSLLTFRFSLLNRLFVIERNEGGRFNLRRLNPPEFMDRFWDPGIGSVFFGGEDTRIRNLLSGYVRLPRPATMFGRGFLFRILNLRGNAQGNGAKNWNLFGIWNKIRNDSLFSRFNDFPIND